MKVNEIREKFINFFKENGHYTRESYPLVPINDDSLLLINAGMAPIKNYFLGIEEPPKKRMATCQKCIRTGDIDNVGKTARHATFFEMLGNFSFGDYFKEEAIKWAWDFVTNYLKLDKELLWVTVYEEDDEALEIWAKNQNVPRERIVKLGKKDNFWEIGTGTGPSGPCSEIYIDRGKRYGCEDPNCKPGCDCDRFLEFWNLVFTQFNKEENGDYTPLEFPNIDTGMGLERIACILQGVDSIFDIDTMLSIRNKVEELSNKKYGKNEKDDISIRIITDHIRAVTFLLSDGVIPSNEGRGYVLRRLLRRAARHGKLLGINKSFLTEISDVVIKEYSSAYSELLEKEEYINKLINVEEKKFQETIDQGLNILSAKIEELNNNNLDMLSGEDAFKLYDTFGFPLEITIEILEESNKKLDIYSFNKYMEEQKNKARSARISNEGEGWKKNNFDEIPEEAQEQFTGYDSYEETSQVRLIIKENEFVDNIKQGEKASIVLLKTPFYGEGGGQVGDKGYIKGKNFEAIVTDCKKTSKGIIIHNIDVIQGTLKVSDIVEAKLEIDVRRDIMKNHSATHLLHKALKKVLGEHVSQAGSHVDDKRLRFDFSHFESLTKEQISKIEEIVNREIFNSLDVTTKNMEIDVAKKLGATAQFDEKYGDIVRVVSMGDFSIELCGGTHIKNTSEILMFKIISESGVASGIRRIEAITGRKVLEYLNQKELKINRITDILKSKEEILEEKIEFLLKDLKESKKEIEKLYSEKSSKEILDILKEAKNINGIKVISKKSNIASIDVLKDTAQILTDKNQDAVVLLGAIIDEKIVYICSVGKEAQNKKLNAGTIAREVSKLSGGGGGGKPSLAQAGGKDLDKFESSLEEVFVIIEKMLE